MSTFQGTVSEFPQIRIDFFRTNRDHAPPLACFLSHVHSDHLAGLEILKAPFVYCSPATREILLRLEKWPHRVDFAKGIVESRVQTYRHLVKILKPIPLDCPTVVELAPGYELRVTLINANHCAGAVMFLIEGQGKAILYTGDIRAEPWWVNELERHPVLISYTSGIKKIDRVYLDTTFATKSNPHRKFQTKAQGIAELLQKVDQYPSDTVFYLEAWTFGYEDIWIALANHLQSQVHLDRYRWSLYKSLSTNANQVPCVEAPALCGYSLGNHQVPGCLTTKTAVRIHSCERLASCDIIRKDVNVVRLIPIINRLDNGREIQELGIGGGKGDMDQIHELELLDLASLKKLLETCASKIKDPKQLEKIASLIKHALQDPAGLRLDPELLVNNPQQEDLSIERLIEYLTKRATTDIFKDQTEPDEPVFSKRTIRFPFSRHSSYEELRDLIRAFKPRDIYPCTVVGEKYWRPELRMRSLFGDLCSSDRFEHDEELISAYNARLAATEIDSHSSQATTVSEVDVEMDEEETQFFTPEPAANLPTRGVKRPRTVDADHPRSTSSDDNPVESVSGTDDDDSQIVKPPKKVRRARDWAYGAASGLQRDCKSWHDFGGLVCVRPRNPEREL